MTEHRSAYGDPLNLSSKLPPHPTDRREAKRGMIRAMLCFVVGMYAIVLVFG